jgi:hypothetical protein
LPPNPLQPAGPAAPPLSYLAGQWASGVLNPTSCGGRQVCCKLCGRRSRGPGGSRMTLTLGPQASLAIRPAIWADTPATRFEHSLGAL